MLSDLPQEILAKVLSFLPLGDVLRLSCVSSKFYDAAGLVYTRRRNYIRCKLYEVGYNEKRWTVSNMSFAVIRDILFSRYGHIVGLWKVVSTPFGGMIKVQFDGFQLVGTRYLAPHDPHIDRPLRPKRIFVVDVDDDECCKCMCVRGFGRPHEADVERLEPNGFQLICKDLKLHSHPSGPSVEFDIWLCDELGIPKVDRTKQTDLLVSKHKTLSEELSVRCYPLHLPPQREAAVIQPGLFKGTYSSHGIEIVLLTYEDNAAIIRKITGDPNVPASKVTIAADLDSLLPEDQESDLAVDLEDLSSSSSNSRLLDGAPLQRFTLPLNIDSRREEIPEFCRHRFASRGQVAGTGHVNPTFIPGQWVIFDDDTFGHMWLYLSSFAMFSRITENL